jgi:hypothetical protein
MMGDIQYWLGECALNKKRAIYNSELEKELIEIAD